MKLRMLFPQSAAACCAAAMMLVLLFLLLTLLAAPAAKPAQSETPVETEQPVVSASAEPLLAEQTEPISFDGACEIAVLTEAGTQTLTLEQYLTGVLFAEMPTSFSMEALKAQAVAARTFTLKTCASEAHDGAICTDSACCQAWLDTPTLRTRFGATYDAALACVAQALHETDGVVAVYGEELIDAVYFSCSGGRTEDAASVWGGEVAYLQSVESPGEEEAAYYLEVAEIPLEEFKAAILAENPSAALSGAPAGWFGDVIYTQGGGVASITVGGVRFTGTQLRRLFGLRSTAFSVAVGLESITFETSGFGHRVGMSQYGAEAMAASGADYTEILQHYYTGITLKTLQE